MSNVKSSQACLFLTKYRHGLPWRIPALWCLQELPSNQMPSKHRASQRWETTSDWTALQYLEFWGGGGQHPLVSSQSPELSADNLGPWSVGDLSHEHEPELSSRTQLFSNLASKSLKREKQSDLSGLSAFVYCLVDSWPRNKSTSYNGISWD